MSDMSDMLRPDICVIGAGSAGLTVAAAARAFDASVVLIERGKMGGDCLNYGCVPSKALIAAARHAHGVRDAARFGIAAGEPQVDFRAVHDHVHDVIAGIAPHDSEERFTGLGATVIRAEARFTDPETVEAGGRRIRARRFVVAAGSSPLVPDIPGLASGPFLTNETVFDLTRLPARLVVIGGGPIGLEMAQAFRRLGSEVTVLEGSKALGKDDPDCAAVVLAALRAEGVGLREGAQVTRVAHGGNAVRVTFQAGEAEETVEGSDLLVAVGRAPNLAGLGLEAAGIAHDRRGIVVDETLRTSNGRVYAIGDIAGGYQFTHWAGYQAGLVVRSVLFRLKAKVDAGRVVWATYTDPELAHAGLTLKEAREKHGDGVRVLEVPFSQNDRARAERETDGLLKVYAARNGRMLGADMVGPGAGELIAPHALAIANGMKVKAFADTVLPYPTLSETAKRAAVDFFRPSLDRAWLKRGVRLLARLG